MYSVILMAALTTSVDLPDRGGCCGGCHGGRSGRGCHGCHGCSGCYGGGYGYGCMGMGYGGCMGMGGMGYGGCMGMGHGGMMMQGGAIQQGEQIKKKPTTKEEEVRVPTSATIVVQLPADAKLLIENEATTSTGASRVFQSPVLNPGKEYHYTLKAEVVRDGKPVRFEKVVEVKAGQITPVTLTLPTLGVAQR
jgi:uncharacterized protein (TIGR03000 family)